MQCLLCQHPVANLMHFIEEECIFCCKGCQIVYQILKAQGSLEQFREHPVFQQALKSGLITNPHFHVNKEEENKSDSLEFQKFHFTIQNMWCPSCAQLIPLILHQERGIRHCAVDYSTDLALIEFSPRLISKEKILRLIKSLGYDPQSLQDLCQPAVNRSLMIRFIVAAFFALNVMMFAYPIYATYFDGGDTDGYAHLFAWLSLAGSLPVLIYSAWPIWRRCYLGLKVGIWGMELLVCLGVAAATGLSLYELANGSPYVYFDSIAVIILFVLLGKIIETKAKFSAKEALYKLSLALPKRGRKRLPSGEEQFVPIKELKPGDLFCVRMGEKIVLDGVVEEGEGTCDESLMTGESLPIIKKVKTRVLAGTLLQAGFLVIKVTATLEESTLHRIVDMVGQEIDHKSKYMRPADLIVKWFVPLVVLLAVMTAGYCFLFDIQEGSKTILQTALVRAISVLLISCPCAIGIAAPLAESYLLNLLATWGIIVRNRGCLNFLGRETHFVFDKTGTLTTGKFSVCGGLEKLSLEDQQALKGLVSRSLHPIAMAISQHLTCLPASFEKIEEIIGNGIQGFLNGQFYCLGSQSYLKELAIETLQPNLDLSDIILTTVFFAKEKSCQAVIILGDRLRDGVQDFIASLKPLPTLLLSGDSQKPVSRVAEACGITEWQAGINPLQKGGQIHQLRNRGEIVAMLGDGMNDAPALTAAHVGIAVVSASDISIQVSDLLMTTQNFHALSLLRSAAIKARKIVNQNLFWAFFYNCIGLVLAVLGLLTPLFAAFAMVMSSLIVLLNAQRLSKMRSE